MNGISPAALEYVREQATQVMGGRVIIEHITDGGYVERDRVHAPAEHTELYDGIFRLWESTGQGTVVVGDDHIHMQSTNLSVPWDGPFPRGMPQRGDEFIIKDHPTDSELVGKRGKILDVAKAGELRATRRFSVQLVQEEHHKGHA